jgi:hypothetical protein
MTIAEYIANNQVYWGKWIKRSIPTQKNVLSMQQPTVKKDINNLLIKRMPVGLKKFAI